ncbi:MULTISPECIES: Gfo/Idh/MocA family protein [unclassified Pseudofrankia]|uniref:Gfo/Idh/MocA family protein n=1 Tax=unclassified Pseudofrankia TaxID=2994372 RepID=UPI0008DB21A0|nr:MULTISPECIES: Gfo/Idh/MocA family oxidoreductase [unclassified Pseudofrankia]MDT3444764.1 Gfo/Idh/MocA family oxidoreductase [Pseudofrankia sp. BMG5.37]OHV50436.1 oxidoreductase [Pseudofrankia sp. BMG5.36]
MATFSTGDEQALRIGVLGAARIAPAALIRPAAAVDGAEVVAVAARDVARARRFASRHGVPRVLADYDAVIDDDEVDAVYIPLIPSAHARWTIRAIEAGKHVLCEKPFTANADEALAVKEAADRGGVVVMEAFHWRYHPLAERLLEIVSSGEIGPVRHVAARLVIPIPNRRDIRWQLALGGGSLMDIGSYGVHMMRTVVGSEPAVVSAAARTRLPDVDRHLTADLRFDGGVTGRLETGMWAWPGLALSLVITGERGEARVLNPLAPHVFHRLTVRTSRRRREKVTGESTYTLQLRAFQAAVRRGSPVLTPPADALANMRVIDDIYRAAGLSPRPSAPTT